MFLHILDREEGWIKTSTEMIKTKITERTSQVSTSQILQIKQKTKTTHRSERRESDVDVCRSLKAETATIIYIIVI